MQCVNCDSTNIKYDKSRDAYICNCCGHVFLKQYFFISYSHLDIEKVRIVRNIVEETFFYEPILFFLKCLSEDNEIIDLIRREINERVWFIYCKSKNAENSKYVREERKYIEHLISMGYNKNILTVDLDNFEIGDKQCANDIRKQVEYQIRKTKIFVSYFHKDTPIVEKIINRLSEMGYSLWYDKKLMLGSDWLAENIAKVKEYSHRDGIFMPILTENVQSQWMEGELFTAQINGAYIFPIILKKDWNLKNVNEYNYILKDKIWMFFDVNDFDKSMDSLIQELKKI